MKPIRLTLATLGVVASMSGPALAAVGSSPATSTHTAATATAFGRHYGHAGHYTRFGGRSYHRYYGYHPGRYGSYTYGYRSHSVYRPYGYHHSYGPRYHSGIYFGYPYRHGYYGHPRGGFSFSFGF